MQPTRRPSLPLPIPDERLRKGLLRLGGLQDDVHLGEAGAPHGAAGEITAETVAVATLAVVEEASQVLNHIVTESRSTTAGRGQHLREAIARSSTQLLHLVRCFPSLPIGMARSSASRSLPSEGSEETLAPSQHADQLLQDEVEEPTYAATSEAVTHCMATSLETLSEVHRSLSEGLQDGSVYEALASLPRARQAILAAQQAAQRLREDLEGPDRPLFTGGVPQDEDIVSESVTPGVACSPASGVAGAASWSRKYMDWSTSPLLPVSAEVARWLWNRLGDPAYSWLAAHRAAAVALILSFLPTGLCIVAIGLVAAVFAIPVVLLLDVMLRRAGVQQVDSKLIRSVVQAIGKRIVLIRLALRRGSHWAKVELRRRSRGSPPGSSTAVGADWTTPPHSFSEACALASSLASEIKHRFLFAVLVVSHLWRSARHSVWRMET